MRQVRVGKVSDKQTTVSVEKELIGVETGVLKLSRDKLRGNLLTVWAASGVEVSTSPIRALPRNVGTLQVMQRENPIAAIP
jgi:hypothetical protein